MRSFPRSPNTSSAVVAFTNPRGHNESTASPNRRRPRRRPGQARMRAPTRPERRAYRHACSGQACAVEKRRKLSAAIASRYNLTPDARRRAPSVFISQTGADVAARQSSAANALSRGEGVDHDGSRGSAWNTSRDDATPTSARGSRTGSACRRCAQFRQSARGRGHWLSYSPREGVVVDVDDLAAEEVASFVGGRGDVRDMERVIQRLAEWGAEVTGAEVVAEADLVISTRPESESRLLIRCERG